MRKSLKVTRRAPKVIKRKLKLRLPAAARRLSRPDPEGSLRKKYGYSSRAPAGKRHAILRRAVSDRGYRKVVGRLNLIANFTKNSNPRLHRVLRSDMAYLKRTFRVRAQAVKREK